MIKFGHKWPISTEINNGHILLQGRFIERYYRRKYDLLNYGKIEAPKFGTRKNTKKLRNIIRRVF